MAVVCTSDLRKVSIPIRRWYLSSVTILGHILDFGQPFKAFGNNYFVKV